MNRPTSPRNSGQEAQIDIEKQDESHKQQGSPQEKPNGPPGAAALYQPKTLKFWLILFCNFLALFLVALDRTIIATAIPRITDEFDSLGDIGWYASAYMLGCAIAAPLFGRIYKFYDMKWIFLTNVFFFEVGSALCGAAPNSNAFIAGRAIAGFFSAAIFTGCMLNTIPMIPLHKRPLYQAINGAIFGISSVMGPLIGGGFTNNVTWRWCFYLNLPVGVVSWICMALIWHPPKQKREPVPIATHIKRLDPLGMSLIAPSVICLLLALEWGGSTYAWNNGRIIALFVLFGVLLLAFAAVQIKMPETATIPARIIKQRSIIFTCLYTLCVSSSMMILLYYIPIWFQTVKLLDAVQSGIHTLPLVLSMLVSSFLGGYITQKIGYYVPSMIACPCLVIIGAGLMSTFDLSTGSSHWIGYQFLCGFGLGLGAQNASIVIQRVLPMPDIPIGLSLMFLLSQLGGAIFTSIGETLLSNTLVSQLSGISGIDPSMIVDEGATELASIVPPQDIVVVQQAYNKACTKIFLVAMGLAFGALLSSLGLEWKSIKKGKNGQEGPGGPGGHGDLATKTNICDENSPKEAENETGSAERSKTETDAPNALK